MQAVRNLDEDDPDVIAREAASSGKPSACALCAASKMPEILVRPSMMIRSCLPNIRSMSSSVTQVSSTVSRSRRTRCLWYPAPSPRADARHAMDENVGLRCGGMSLRPTAPRLRMLAVLRRLAVFRPTQQPLHRAGRASQFQDREVHAVSKVDMRELWHVSPPPNRGFATQLLRERAFLVDTRGPCGARMSQPLNHVKAHWNRHSISTSMLFLSVSGTLLAEKRPG